MVALKRAGIHVLAKTGRRSGGTTPTGYASGSFSHVTADGKSQKACKLSLIEKEKGIIAAAFENTRDATP